MVVPHKDIILADSSKSCVKSVPPRGPGHKFQKEGREGTGCWLDTISAYYHFFINCHCRNRCGGPTSP